MVFVEGATWRTDVDFVPRDYDDLVGEMVFHDPVQSQSPVPTPVVGDGDAVKARLFDLRYHRFRDFGRRRLEPEHFPDVGVNIQSYLHGQILTQWPWNWGERFSANAPKPSARSSVLCRITLRSASKRNP